MNKNRLPNNIEQPVFIARVNYFNPCATSGTDPYQLFLNSQTPLID